MKKILVALALAAFASAASAAVVGSAHDMRVAGGTAGSCQYCHAPHLWVDPGLTAAPLWNRTAPAVAAITNRAGDTTTDVTRACLSCHDGATQLGAMANNPDTALTATITGPIGNVGLDLTNDHPVGVTLVAGPEYQAPPAAFVMDAGTVGCSTCHDVHNQGPAAAPSFLVVDPALVDFCAQCHIK